MMTNVMTFPESADEFMEKYKIIDTENVYTNGADLVPIFRMKQWFEHSEKHGRWISDITDGYENICSICHHEFVDKWDNDSNYCPNCGARMIDEVKE